MFKKMAKWIAVIELLAISFWGLYFAISGRIPLADESIYFQSPEVSRIWDLSVYPILVVIGMLLSRWAKDFTDWMDHLKDWPSFFKSCLWISVMALGFFAMIGLMVGGIFTAIDMARVCLIFLAVLVTAAFIIKLLWKWLNT